MVLKNLISETVLLFRFFFFFSKPSSTLRLKLTHPLKHNCLMELDWDQNRNAENRICLSLFNTHQ